MYKRGNWNVFRLHRPAQLCRHNNNIWSTSNTDVFKCSQRITQVQDVTSYSGQYWKKSLKYLGTKNMAKHTRHYKSACLG